MVARARRSGAVERCVMLNATGKNSRSRVDSLGVPLLLGNDFVTLALDHLCSSSKLDAVDASSVRGRSSLGPGAAGGHRRSQDTAADDLRFVRRAGVRCGRGMAHSQQENSLLAEERRSMDAPSKHSPGLKQLNPTSVPLSFELQALPSPPHLPSEPQ